MLVIPMSCWGSISIIVFSSSEIPPMWLFRIPFYIIIPFQIPSIVSYTITINIFMVTISISIKRVLSNSIAVIVFIFPFSITVLRKIIISIPVMLSVTTMFSVPNYISLWAPSKIFTIKILFSCSCPNLIDFYNSSTNSLVTQKWC